ncbi:MAG: hypothetical protein LBO02_02170 [Holosporaceae bacterium]|jgi:hypothetical protein|nr:hypothetical protein [Holosporaceae bacterium]
MRKLLLSLTLLTAPQVIAEETQNVDSFNGTYLGAGLGYGFSENTIETSRAGIPIQNISAKANGFFGSLLLGSGKTANAHPFYCSGEILIDFAKTQNDRCVFQGANEEIKSNGVAPYFGFRVGCASDGALFFGKLGLVHKRVSVDNSMRSIKISKLIPVWGLGVEKSICNKCTSRVDIEYRMKTDKSADNYKLEVGRSINLRIAFIYNVKF